MPPMKLRRSVTLNHRINKGKPNHRTPIVQIANGETRSWAIPFICYGGRLTKQANRRPPAG